MGMDLNTNDNSNENDLTQNINENQKKNSYSQNGNSIKNLESTKMLNDYHQKSKKSFNTENKIDKSTKDFERPTVKFIDEDIEDNDIKKIK